MASKRTRDCTTAETHSLGSGLWSSWLWFLALPLAVALAYHFLLRNRPDYLGHFLAGFGATLLAMRGVAVPTQGAPFAVGIGTLICLFLGLLAEATVFALGGFDSQTSAVRAWAPYWPAWEFSRQASEIASRIAPRTCGCSFGTGELCWSSV